MSVDSHAETVLVERTGKYWNQRNRWDRPDGVVSLTTHRFAFQSHTSALRLEFPLETIESMEAARVWWIVPAINVRVGGIVHTFTLFLGAGSFVAAFDAARRNAEKVASTSRGL